MSVYEQWICDRSFQLCDNNCPAVLFHKHFDAKALEIWARAVVMAQLIVRY